MLAASRALSFFGSELLEAIDRCARHGHQGRSYANVLMLSVLITFTGEPCDPVRVSAGVTIADTVIRSAMVPRA